MSYKEWERALLKQLTVLPKNERLSITDYYREMYGDKQDLGLTDEEILQEFGSPEACAKKILSEARETGSSAKTPSERKAKPSVAYIVGVVFFTLILILPLAGVGVALVAVLASGVVCGAVCALAGVAYTVFAPFTSLSGVGAAGITAHIGTGVCLCGVGLMLFVLFFLLTKYTSILLTKWFRVLYGRRKRQ